jgi:protein-disulfide isomerase
MKKLLTLLMIFVCVNSAAQADLLEKQPYDHVLGSDTAPVTVIEYFSLSCPHCASFQKDVFPVIDEQYINNGKVRFIARPYVTDQASLFGTQLLQCVPQDKYHAFIKVLLSMQEKWAFSADVKGNLKTIAGVGGVSGEAFDACLADKTKEEAALKIRQEGEKELKITGVPTLFVNGTRTVGGKKEELLKVIDETLANHAADAPVKKE